ncbi:hypothetical protein ABK046_46730, partial [Streptomyces caeruleatus]
VGLGPIVVTRAGADTINGATSYTIPGATDPIRSVAIFTCDAAGQWTAAMLGGSTRPVSSFTSGTPTLVLNTTNELSGTVSAATLPAGVTA